MSDTTLKSVLTATRDFVLVRLGRAPSCEWVCERLSAYYDWDLSLAELRVVESHKYRCADCAREWDETRRVREWFDRATLSEDEARDRERRVDDIMATIRDYEAEQAVCQPVLVPMWQRRWVRGLAATCALAMIVPAMAYVGARMWMGESEADGSRSGALVGQAVDERPADDTEVAGLATVTVDGHAAPRPSGIDTALPARPEPIPWPPADKSVFSPDLDEFVDAEIEAFAAKAEVEMRLPHTDGEYKAWARREYPHILWLYDLLRAKHDYEGGWRELLVDSDEILRFDYRAHLDLPNRRPSVGALDIAALSVGYRL